MTKYLSIIFFAFLLSTNALAQTNVVPDDVELQVLKNLYDSMGGSGWNNKTHWPLAGAWPATATSAQFGTWWGITVVNGDIVTLNFNTINASGIVPRTISKLTALKTIDIEHNSLVTGTIPPAIGNLNNLTSITFFLNGMSGTLPPSMASLTNLTYLNLQSNQFSGAIPTFLNTFTQLTTLNLSVNKFTGLVPDLSGLTALNYLSLGTNPLLTPAPFPAWLYTLTHLSNLIWNGCSVTGTISESIGNLHGLGNLQLASNQLTGPIPQAIGTLNSLVYLDLNSNQLTGPIPPGIGNLHNLVSIYLNTNLLTGTIPSSLGSLTNLQILQLHKNHLSGSIPASFGALTHLSYLYAYQNYMTGPLPTELGGCVALNYLDLSLNSLSGTIPSSFGNLTKLLNCNLANNQFTGSFPSINAWTTVSVVNLSNNMFSGAFPDAPAAVKLASLAAPSNQFTSLPSGLLSLPLLAGLNFDNNELSSIPNFASSVNKANLTLTLTNNHLDFSQLEPLIGAGIRTITYATQKNIRDLTTKGFTQSSALVIPARSKGSFSTVTWEKLQSGGTWSAVNGTDDDATFQTFTRNVAVTSDEGTYHWKMTSTKATGLTLISDPIVVKVSQRFALDNYSFQYRYDSLNRMIAKKIPGADWEYMVYDNRDRLVLTQDANERAINRWTFTKYDTLNRPIMTGFLDTTVLLSQWKMQSVVNNYYSRTWVRWGEGRGTVVHGYTCSTYPVIKTPGKYLTITYYDDYGFNNNDVAYGYQPAVLAGQTVNGYSYSQDAAYYPRLNGRITGTKVLSGDNDPYWLKTVNYYDYKGQVIQTISDHERIGMVRSTSLYDFAGRVLANNTAYLEQRVKWTGLTGATVDGPIMTALNYDPSSGNSGAASTAVLPAGTDGWVETTYMANNSGRMAVGLSSSNANNNSNTIGYGFLMQPWGTASTIIESGGNTRYTFPTTQPVVYGDVLRVERTGTVVTYKRNGVVVYTSHTASSTQLLVDVALWNHGSILNTRASFGATTQNILRTFEYDHTGRLLKTNYSLNGATPIVLAKNDYNELGQLVDKKLHSTDGTTFKQSEDYRYNIRGWLTSINNSTLVQDATNDDTNDLFGMNLLYEQAGAGLNNVPQFNGNISAMKWSRNLARSSWKKDQAYIYGYDTLNRIKSANYLLDSTTWTNPIGAFNENNYKYDLNGNILALNRTGSHGLSIDQLVYNYGSDNSSGNQLVAVTDAAVNLTGFSDGNINNTTNTTDYTYDLNGNMTVDKNKGITSITYNYLNLPTKVTKATNEYVQYIYDATGRKLRQDVFTAAGVRTKRAEYIGELYYEMDTLRFINHEEGRIIMKTTTPEFQYHLKDHLGNVRMTFTTKPDIDTDTATVETSRYAKENSNFLNIDDARKINSTIFDHTYNGQTPPTDGAYSQRLSGKAADGSTREVIGLAKSISVMPGDHIDMEVYAKYVDLTSSTLDQALKTIVTNIATNAASPGTVVDGLGYPTNTSSILPFPGLLAKSSSPTAVPKAYMNWLVFDRNYNLDMNKSGFAPITAAAKEDGISFSSNPEGGSHEHLTASVDISDPGYVYIWLSNDNDTPVEVYFDDFKVTQIKSPVVQMDDYYPFGLTFNSYSRENATPNKWKFQGQEHTDDLGLNWDSFKWRNHQPDIGRFFNIDPLASKYVYNSPYAFSENHVTSHVELEGLEKVSIHSASFAPFNTFGGPYKGDGANRKFSTNPNASARIRGQVNINATSSGVKLEGISATGSTSHNTWTGSSTTSPAKMEGSVTESSTGGKPNPTTVDFHLSGSNKLIPGSPDIDAKGSMTVTRQDLGDKGSVINFSGSATGDKFPANETFVADQNGTGVFLGVSGADGSPFTALPGDNNRTMSEFNIGIQYDANGNTQRVQYNGKSYTVEAWNKQFTKKDPQSGNTSTSNK